MSYNEVDELPEQIRYNLPKSAKIIFMNAYNSAWEHYKDYSRRFGSKCREELANKAAWSAVKKQYYTDAVPSFEKLMSC